GFDLPARLCRAGEDQPTHIIPVMVGDAERTMAWSEALLDRGAFVQGIRPPTVPEGTSRLRATPMATHSAADIDQALAAFGSLATDAARRLRAVC
ncbi:MAG TPA: aminotransferase class I/II-fold pyridoxal phosphate-dependent enzyme, partial [Terriglobales bacterium]|nr:aminotransferase class I/II-fold pyridoxal phosphate-dependent enzyme [Terriglobales bacterium]